MNSKQIEKAIQKNAKKVIAESGIGSSRAGNKELSHLATKLSSQPIKSLEAAQVFGERLGKKIVELSQSANKQHLDRGIIRTLVLTKAIPSIDDLPAEIQVAATVSNASQVSKAPTTAKSPSPQKAQPVAPLADKADVEDNVPVVQAELEDEEASKTHDTEVAEAVDTDEADTEDNAPAVQAELEDEEASKTYDTEVAEAVDTEQEEEVSEPVEELVEAPQEEDDSETTESDAVTDVAVVEEHDAEDSTVEEQDAEDDTAIVTSDTDETLEVEQLDTGEELSTEKGLESGEEPATEAV